MEKKLFYKISQNFMEIVQDFWKLSQGNFIWKDFVTSFFLTFCENLFLNSSQKIPIKPVNLEFSSNEVVLVKKAQARIWKKNPTFKFITISFSTWKPNPLGRSNCSVPNICSLVPKINVSHTQQRYLCPQNQNCIQGKVDLKFFLSYRLRTSVKIIIFSTFYVIDK